MGPGGSMRQPGAPMDGPGGSMGGPGLGGPKNYMDGPRGSMNGLGGPMGGSGDFMGGPEIPMTGRGPMEDGLSGPLRGSGGPMGEPGGPIGGPGGFMGGPGDRMGRPGRPMEYPGGPMGEPDRSPGYPGGPMDRPGDPMGRPGGPMGGAQDYIYRQEGPMGGPGGAMGGLEGPMGGPGGPMRNAGGFMGSPQDYIERQGGPIGGRGGAMGGPGSAMGGLEGSMGGPGSPFNGPAGPMGGQGGAISPQGIPAQGPVSQNGVYMQRGSGYGPGSFGEQYGGQPYGISGYMGRGPSTNFWPPGQRMPNTVYTQRPPDPGGPFDPNSGGPLGPRGDPAYIKKVEKGEINNITNTNMAGMFRSTPVLGAPYNKNEPGIPVNNVYVNNGRNGPENGFPYGPGPMNNGVSHDIPANGGYPSGIPNMPNSFTPNAPNIPNNAFPPNDPNMHGFNGPQNIGYPPPENSNDKIGSPMAGFLVPPNNMPGNSVGGIPNDFSRQNYGLPAQTPETDPSYTLKTGAEIHTDHKTSIIQIINAVTTSEKQLALKSHATAEPTKHQTETINSQTVNYTGLTVASIKYDELGRPITSLVPFYPHYGPPPQNTPIQKESEENQTTTSQASLKSRLELYPDPAPQPASISTSTTVVTSSCKFLI